MQIPSFKFPTDNLYKFVSLMGVVFFILPLALSFYYVLWTLDSYYEIAGEVNTLDARVNFFETDLDRYKNENGILVFTNDEDQKKFLDEYRTFLFDLAYIDVESNQLEDRLSLAKFFVFLSASVSLVGCLFMLWGFINWYHRLQRPQDRMLLLKIKQIERENV